MNDATLTPNLIWVDTQSVIITCMGMLTRNDTFFTNITQLKKAYAVVLDYVVTGKPNYTETSHFVAGLRLVFSIRNDAPEINLLDILHFSGVQKQDPTIATVRVYFQNDSPILPTPVSPVSIVTGDMRKP